MPSVLHIFKLSEKSAIKPTKHNMPNQYNYQTDKAGSSTFAPHLCSVERCQFRSPSRKSGIMTEGFHSLPQSLQGNFVIVSQTRTWPLPFIAFPIHCSVIRLSFNNMYYQLPTMSFNKSIQFQSACETEIKWMHIHGVKLRTKSGYRKQADVKLRCLFHSRSTSAEFLQ